MSQNTYDMKSPENNINPYLNSNNLTNLKYYDSKIGKENPNSLAYKLRELKENQNKMKINNDSYKANLNNSNSNLTENSQITNKSRYSRHKNIPIPNNYINDNTNNNSYVNNSRKNTSRQKQTSSTAQIDEQYEMQKLLELENKNYENKFKDVVYKKIKDKDINLNNNNSINAKNNIYSNNNINSNDYNEQVINKSGYSKNLNSNYKENDIDKNIKNYIDEQAEKIKEFVHDEINNLHVDLIRQFEIQNSQNLKMLQEFSLVNKQLYQEIQKLKNENQMLKKNLE